MSNVPDNYRPDLGLRAFPLPACQLVCSFFFVFFPPFLSPFVCPSPPLSPSLIEVFAESTRDEKQTKCLLIQQPCITALSKSITLITQPKKSATGYESQISSPSTHRLLMHTHKVRTSWWNRNGAQQTLHPLPSAFFFSFHFLSCSFSFSSFFFMFPLAGSTNAHANSAKSIFS